MEQNHDFIVTRMLMILGCLIIAVSVFLAIGMRQGLEEKVDDFSAFLDNNADIRIVPKDPGYCVLCQYSNQQPVCLWHYKMPNGELYDGYAVFNR